MFGPKLVHGQSSVFVGQCFELIVLACVPVRGTDHVDHMRLLKPLEKGFGDGWVNEVVHLNEDAGCPERGNAAWINQPAFTPLAVTENHDPLVLSEGLQLIRGCCTVDRDAVIDVVQSSHCSA